LFSLFAGHLILRKVRVLAGQKNNSMPQIFEMS